MTEFEVNDRRHWAKGQENVENTQEDSKEDAKTDPLTSLEKEPQEAQEAKSQEPSQDETAKNEAQAQPKSDKADTARKSSRPAPEASLPVNFQTIVIGFGATALAHMGEAPTADGSKIPVDLQTAKHYIDLLGVLEQKTKGNLQEDEAQLLRAFLYDLRIKFVTLSKNQPEK